MAYRTVLLKSTNDNFIELEVDTGQTVTPGMLVERVGDAKCQPHSTAGGDAQKLIAIENYLEGEDVDTTYADGDRCIVKVAAPGERFAVLHQTDSSSGVYGMVNSSDYLESDGNGYLRPDLGPYADSSGGGGNVYSENIIAVALEDNDTANSSAPADPRFAAGII